MRDFVPDGRVGRSWVLSTRMPRFFRLACNFSLASCAFALAAILQCVFQTRLLNGRGASV